VLKHGQSLSRISLWTVAEFVLKRFDLLVQALYECDQLWIEVFAGLLADEGLGFLDGPGRLVGTWHAQGIVDVADGDDAAGERDLVAGLKSS